jgi:predicted nucleotidyltransferase
MIVPSTLHEIVADYAPRSKTLFRVGVVGSYARNEACENSDVDLVFDTGGKLIDEAVLSAGLGIKSVLKDQFNTETDIINYATILHKQSNADTLETRGYELMMADLKWIWSRA